MGDEKNAAENSALSAGADLHIGNTIAYVFDGRHASIPRDLTLNIPADASGIIGRERELQETCRLLHMGRPAMLVNGVGGMGKTGVAAKYIGVYRENTRTLPGSPPPKTCPMLLSTTPPFYNHSKTSVSKPGCRHS